MSRSYWDNVARRMADGYHLDRLMARQKGTVHRALLREWWRGAPGAAILKTDLFEEALGEDQLLLDWPDDEGGSPPWGLDLSHEIVRRAHERIRDAGRSANLLVGDARRSPFRDGVFDLVYSCSTLDHFKERDDLIEGVAEGLRILRPGGEMILLLDNPRSLFYGFVRFLDRRGLVGFRLGETLAEQEVRDLAGRLGADVIDLRAVYHVPRVFFSVWCRLRHACRLGGTDRLVEKILAWSEGMQGKPGQYLTGWYVAACLRKRDDTSR